MSKVRVTTGIVEGKLGDTHGSFVSSEDYFDLVKGYKELETQLAFRDRESMRLKKRLAELLPDK